jgi:F-type H+-transporting ATPase subunit delta
MAELTSLARPYAEAVFELAVEADHIDQWSANLNLLAAIVKDPMMAEVISNPQVDKTTLTNIWLDICEGQLSEAGKNLLKMIIENKRLAIIPSLFTQYQHLKAQHQGYITVEIASPYPLHDAQIENIKDVLQQRLGKTIEIDQTIDKTLLGGWLIRTGDQIIDMSIKGRFQQLTTELSR